MHSQGYSTSASGRNRLTSAGAIAEAMRGIDAGRGKPRLYKIRFGPFAGDWVCRDAVTGIAGNGSVPKSAYDLWDLRTGPYRTIETPTYGGLPRFPSWRP